MNFPKMPTAGTSKIGGLYETVSDIVRFLPSLAVRGDNYTTMVDETAFGRIIRALPQQSLPAGGSTTEKVEAEVEDFFSTYNSCDLYNLWGGYRTSKYEDASSGIYLEMNKYTVNLNGIYANIDRHTYRVTDVANDFFTKNPTLSATDNSAIYGSLRLDFYLTSGMTAPSATSVFDYPPIFYTWNVSAEWNWEMYSRFDRPGLKNYTYVFPSKGNVDGTTHAGMPTEVNSIVGLFKFDKLKNFSDAWHNAGGALSGMSNPKFNAYCKTADSNPTIFLSFTDELLDYIHTANGEGANT